jgi:hypothetical protein
MGAVLVLATWVVFSHPVYAEGKSGQVPTVAEELEGFEEGFDGADPFAAADEEIEDKVLDAPDSDEGKLHIGGFVELDTQIRTGTGHDKVSVLKPQVFLETEYRFNTDHKFRASGLAFYDAAYDILDRPKNDPQRLDDEAKDIELRDFYLDSGINDTLSVRAGRQIIAWGDSNWARITDVVNPRDLTQPGIIV